MKNGITVLGNINSRKSCTNIGLKKLYIIKNLQCYIPCVNGYWCHIHNSAFWAIFVDVSLLHEQHSRTLCLTGLEGTAKTTWRKA